MEIRINSKGEMVSLTNLQTGQNYADGFPMWRLYVDTKDEKEIEVAGKNHTPVITQEGNVIALKYQTLKTGQKQMNMALELKVVLENDKLRFYSKISNNEPQTIVRELQYPLVGDCQLPDDHQLLTTHLGGQLYPDPVDLVSNRGYWLLYMSPTQYYRQMDLKYPSGIAANCFAFVGENQGLYIASHDPSFQDTWHGLRVYPDADGVFRLLEAGIYKYPNCLYGQTWENDANVIAPYVGDWHQTSKIYRKWADTWWSYQEPPQWVKEMKSWQRIIFKHQYGEIFFQYADLAGRIKNVGKSVSADAVLAFGWWLAGMDNGNPHYVTDPQQGGDNAWKKAIADYRKDGEKLLLYFNGKLIDTESEFFTSGEGQEVCYRSNTGTIFTEQYRFRGFGTFTGYYNARSFAVADTRHPKWQKKLMEMADIAYDFGANSVFYDQLGYGEGTTNWDLSQEFPIPNLYTIADKANVLKMIHEYIDKKDKDFAIGTEHITDATCQHVDYVHSVSGFTGANSFVDWFRYTFPEVIVSDRELRDDTDVERRANHTVLKGLRNDIEIFRCRDLIDKTPNYQKHLAQLNKLKDKYKDLLLVGTYRDTEGFSNTNKKIEARSFTNTNKMALVVTQSQFDTEQTTINVPGYTFKESSHVGNVRVNASGNNVSVSVGKHGLAVLVYEKTK